VRVVVFWRGQPALGQAWAYHAIAEGKTLELAEKKAMLTKLVGSLWHAYSRKWAIERKHLPLKDVAAAGGWKDINTLLEVYQQSDEESVLVVTSFTVKLRERGVA
jgi:hypothetical protein